MPILHKYKGKKASYILTSIQGSIVTFQLTGEGQQKLKEAGIQPGKPFGRALLLDLYRNGDVYTHGSGPGEIGSELDTRQMEFDFSDDSEPETMFPHCSACSSLHDLHFVEELKESEPYAVILCKDCRSNKSSSVDTSVPLPLVTRKVMNRILAMKHIEKVDASVTTYQELLYAEFSKKWEALSKRKPSQEKLFESDDGSSKLF